MKKLTMTGVILLATFIVGCSANRTHVSKSPDAGASGQLAQAGQPYACQAMRSHDSEMFCRD